MNIQRKIVTEYTIFDDDGNSITVPDYKMQELARALFGMVGLEVTNSREVTPHGSGDIV